MPEEKPAKRCFVICPIGEQGTEVRRRTDNILREVIRPVTEPRGYRVLPAHEDARPGIITSQIVQHLVEDDLVIADLTGPNPNVMYEVGVRNAARKPLVLICQKGQEIPFDLDKNRVVFLEYPEWGAISAAKKELARHIDSAADDPTGASASPVSQYLGDSALLAQAQEPRGEAGEVGTEVLRAMFGLRDELRAHASEFSRSLERARFLEGKRWVPIPDRLGTATERQIVEPLARMEPFPETSWEGSVMRLLAVRGDKMGVPSSLIPRVFELAVKRRRELGFEVDSVPEELTGNAMPRGEESARLWFKDANGARTAWQTMLAGGVDLTDWREPAPETGIRAVLYLGRDRGELDAVVSLLQKSSAFPDLEVKTRFGL